jgi:autotransporter-associated beta strand protein
VLDASTMPFRESVPIEPTSQSLTLDEGVTATANAQDGDFTYTTSNGTVTITGYTGVGGVVNIPASVAGLPVTAIGSWAFSGKSSLTSVTIPASVTGIGSSAFYRCESLTGIIIPVGVTSISDSAFSLCISLATVTIPASVTSIGGSAFYQCVGLTSITIPAGVVSIGDSAFSLSGLKSVNIPASVVTIGAVQWPGFPAFSGCNALSSITVDSSNTAYASVDGVLYNKALSSVIQCPAGRSGSVAIPSTVTSIGSYAFSGCKRLTSVTIPASVTAIGSSAFSGCNALPTITVDSSNTAYASVDGVLYNKTLSSLIQCPAGKTGSVAIPSTVTSIGSSAFSGCTGLTSVTIPASVTSIDISAFMNCTGLTSVTIPVGVKVIGASAFSGCTGLTSVTIPASVTIIRSSAFSGCTGLTSVTIPVGVIILDGSVFSNCTSLTAIIIPASVTTIGSSAFSGCNALSTITVDISNTAYASVDGVLYNKALSSVIQCPAGKTGSVAIPSTVTSIGSSAFSGCTSLTSVTIPASVTSIGISAFSKCYALKSMYILASPPSLGFSAFDSSPLTVYRLANATGWSSTLGGRPVQVFQPVDVAVGQASAPTLGYTTDRLLKKGAGIALLTTPSARTGGTVVEAGELVVENKDALGDGLLEVQAGAKATFQTGYDTVSVTSLSLTSTSRLELGTSKLTVAANGFTESDIRTELIAGRGDGSWNGTGGITSTFAGGDRAIGYRVIDGVMEVAYAAPGDSNLDGVIDILDLSEILSAGKFNTGASANWQQGDTNYDGMFDILDISEILGTNLFNQGTYLTQAPASSLAVEACSTLDRALVCAALAADASTPTTTKRKSV